MDERLLRITREINELRRKDRLTQVGSAVQVGRHLIEARRLLNHGDWTLWRRTRVRLAPRTTTNLIALARFQESQPGTFRKLADLGLGKLYRIAQLPGRFLKALRPEARFRIPGCDQRKSLEDMGPVELNRCAQRWIHQRKQRRPNQAVRAATRISRQLQEALQKCAGRLASVRSDLRTELIGRLAALEGCIRPLLGDRKHREAVA
jgi:hypothetical protein